MADGRWMSDIMLKTVHSELSTTHSRLIFGTLRTPSPFESDSSARLAAPLAGRDWIHPCNCQGRNDCPEIALWKATCTSRSLSKPSETPVISLLQCLAGGHDGHVGKLVADGRYWTLMCDPESLSPASLHLYTRIARSETVVLRGTPSS